jgi:hypothetical protein
MDHLEILDVICKEIKEGSARDKVRAEGYTEEQVALFEIMQRHVHLWPDEMIYKGRNHTPRVVVKPLKRTQVIGRFLWKLNLINRNNPDCYLSVGGNKSRKGDPGEIIPKVYWNAVQQSCREAKINPDLFEMTKAVFDY